jgi:two-component system competent response regulator ComA
MQKQIKIIVIDDHPAMAFGIAKILEQEPGLVVLGVATSGQEGFELVETHRPAVVILDLNMPDLTGVQLAASIKEQYPAIHIVIHTGYDYEPYFNKLVQSGVSGILNKNAMPKEMVDMIQAVVSGYTIMPLTLFHQVQLQRPDDIKLYWEANLSTTEEKILMMIADKHTNSNIAKVIHMSESSVENYLKKIYRKLGVRSKNEAIAKIARENHFQKKEQLPELNS